jgi:YkoY family integral membrane protein
MNFFDQTFQAADIGTVGVLLILEALLSADNALVLAIMVRHLPPKQRKQALMYGLGGAFVLRTIAIILATSIIKFWWLQLIGAAYLIYLPIKHFISSSQSDEVSKTAGMSFWATVVYLNLVDLAFALDSVVAAVAVVDTVHHPDKLWVVVAGAIIGIVLLRFAAGAFIRLLEKYPVLDHVAYLLVGWAGVKMLFISGHTFEKWYVTRGGHLPFEIPEMPGWLFWGGMAVIAIGGTLIALKHKAPDGPGHEQEAQDVDDALPGHLHMADRPHDPSEEDAPKNSSGSDDDGKKA